MQKEPVGGFMSDTVKKEKAAEFSESHERSSLKVSLRVEHHYTSCLGWRHYNKDSQSGVSYEYLTSCFNIRAR